VPIRRSVQRYYVVCLECGFRVQALRRHPRVQHGVKPEDYRARWILPIGYPLTAPDYSARRSRWPRNSASDANRVLWQLARGPPLAAARRRGWHAAPVVAARMVHEVKLYKPSFNLIGYGSARRGKRS
jgi:hypothetical protein